jgi:CDP-4-dehydro-6-deoxyglucose reductase, E3
MTYQISIKPSGRQFSAEATETVLNAAIDAGINLPYGCKNGICGACKGKVLEGKVDYGQHQTSALSEAEKAEGKALFCCAIAQSDLTIECREVDALGGIKPRILPVRVQSLTKAAPDVMVMHLKLPSNERMQFLAGQYIEFLLKDGKRRAFSLANAPHDDAFLELHIRLVEGGSFTQYVFNEMQEKAILRLEGPLGSFFLREESKKPVIFVAGGTGFAPIKGIVEHMLFNNIQRQIIVYWGAKTRADLYMADLPKAWATHYSHVTFIPVLSAPTTEDAWLGRTGYVHQAVLDDHADLSAYQVYCCGAPVMVETAQQTFAAQGLPEEEFFSDAFSYATPIATT